MKEQIIDGINYRLNEETKTAEVIKKNGGYEGDIIIPKTVEFAEKTYRITSIGESAFYLCDSLTSIVIPDSVTSIGEGAFDDCSMLNAIEVAEGNTMYDSRANCNALIHTATNTLIRGCQNTTIPDSVTSIGDWAFGGCESLTEITIPNSIKSIGYEAFSICKSLKSITIPDSVTSIGERAFEYCKSLESIAIGNSVKSIDYHTFFRCSLLTDVTIGNSVTSIGDCAFEDCTSLKSITIPDSIESIGKEAFYCCKSLQAIRYGGTIAQWKKINLANDTFKGWNRRSAINVVHCTDGNMWVL
jgi:hypothetical protein